MTSKFAACLLAVAGAMLGGMSAAGAQSIDPCLVGDWEGQSIAFLHDPGAPPHEGGGGFRVTFDADGAETVDYSAIVPVVWPAMPHIPKLTTAWRGSATVLISTHQNTARIERIERDNVQMMHTNFSGDRYVRYQLGPGVLGWLTQDIGYLCDGDSLEYKARPVVGEDAEFLVKLTRSQAKATPTLAASGPPVAVNGRTWLTPTEIKDRPQDLAGVWTTPQAASDDQIQPLQLFVVQGSDLKIRNLSDATGFHGHLTHLADTDRWAGTGAPPGVDGTGFYTGPFPWGTCPKLQKWSPGFLDIVPGAMHASGEWRDKHIDATICVRTDDPDTAPEVFDRFLGVSFVPIIAGKYMELVGAPAVGDQAAQFKAAVRLTARYDGIGNAEVRASADHGSLALIDRAHGAYQFLADQSGAYELRFEVAGSDGVVLHIDRIRIEVPGIPGVGK